MCEIFLTNNITRFFSQKDSRSLEKVRLHYGIMDLSLELLLKSKDLIA